MNQRDLAISLRAAIESYEVSNADANTPYTDRQSVIESTEQLSSKLHSDLTTQSLEIANHIFLTWKGKEEKENGWRKAIAVASFFILVGQLCILAWFMFEIGRGTMRFELDVMQLYIAGVFAEVVGIIVLITKYMYSERTLKPLEIVQRILENIGSNNSKYFNDHK